MPSQSRSSLVVPTQFVALALVWGSSFLFMKVGLEGLAPTQIVLGRVVLGALALGVLLVVTRGRLPSDPVTWAHLVALGIVLCLVPFLLFAWAEQHISSGLASIYNATTPLMTVLVTILALPQERPTRDRLLGLGLGFAGVLVVLAPWRGVGGGGAWAQLACLGATACYGLGLVHLRRNVQPRGLGPVEVAAGQVGSAAVIMLVASPFIAAQPVHLSLRVVLCIVGLGVLGTGLAYAWNTNIVAHWGAAPASTVTYLTPVVGVALGVMLLGESLAWNEPAGAVLVILGILASQGRLAALVGGRRRAAEPGGLVASTPDGRA